MILRRSRNRNARGRLDAQEALIEALVAASYASEEELVQSQRTYKLHVGGDAAFEELIDSEAKGALPDGLVEVGKRRAEYRA